jgi:hypothetical protein
VANDACFEAAIIIASLLARNPPAFDIASYACNAPSDAESLKATNKFTLATEESNV